MKHTGYTKKDFINMKFDVTEIGDDFLETFEELKNISEFRVKKIPGLLNKQTVFKYICLVYDPNSPYVKSFPSQVRRKKEVAKMLGLIKKTIPDNVTQMLMGTNHIVNSMIISFSIMLYDLDWITLTTYQDKIEQSLFLLRNSVEIDKDLNQAIILWNQEADAIKKKMLSEDTSRTLNKELLKRVVHTNLGITPENIASLKAEV